MKALEDLQKGDCVRYQQTDWFVAERDVCKESENYQETQWTLTARNRRTFYLIRSEEKKDNAIETVWVLTQQILLASVNYPLSQDNWTALLEDDFVSSPPPTLKLGQTIMNFDGETSGLAEDDEGQTVTKVTWDYYDDRKIKNLAIEIWKESDRDYPEAYEGTVVRASDFEVLSAEARKAVLRKVKPVGQGILSALWTLFFIGLFLFMAGVPFDYLLAGAVPVLAIFALVQEASAFWSLVAVLMWLVLAGMLFFMDFIKASFWGVTLGAFAASILVPRIVASAKPDLAEETSGLIFFANLLPPLWIYSFFIYFRFAPGPHEFFQLAAACLLPAAITSIIYLIIRRFQHALQ